MQSEKKGTDPKGGVTWTLYLTFQNEYEVSAAFFSGLATEYGLIFKKRRVEASGKGSFSSTSMAAFVYKQI